MSTFSVFTYGTLQFPEVMTAVIGKELKSVAATLADYQCLKFKKKTYPGLTEKVTCSVDGMLYRGIDGQTLDLLDQFEDVAYERYLVDVKVDTKTEQAFVYVTKDKYLDCLSDKEWDLEEFKRKYLSLYLRDISKL